MTTTDIPKKIDLGPQTEDDVQHFVEHAFSADFVFRSPQRLDRGKEHETTDVFALFDEPTTLMARRALRIRDGRVRT
jgi:hypothetical protein